MKNIPLITNFKAYPLKQLFILFVFLTMGMQTTIAQTTRYWVGGTSGNFNDDTKWSLSSGGAPLSPGSLTFPNSDVFVIDANSGSSVTIFSNVVNTNNKIGKLQVTGNSVLKITSHYSNTNDLKITATATDALVVDAGAALIVNGYSNGVNNYDMIVTMNGGSGVSSAVINGIVKVTVDVGGTSRGAFRKLTNANITFNDGSEYVHDVNDGYVPIATWGLNSLCNITGAIDKMPRDLVQDFGNRAWNCANQNSDFLPGVTFFSPIANTTLTLGSTGSNKLIFVSNVVAAGNVLITGGKYILNANTANRVSTFNDLTINGGYLSVSEFATGSGQHELNVTGNLEINGGTLDVCKSATAIGRLNVKKNITLNGGLLTCSQTPSNTNGGVFFVGTTPQIYSKTGTVISGGVNFIINGNAIVDFGNSIIDGSTGKFTLGKFGKIITSNNAGISSTGATGTIQNTGARIFNSTANYEFRGLNTGVFGLSTANVIVGVLTFNNPAGVTINQNFAVKTLELTEGAVTTNSNYITISSGGNYLGGSPTAYVNGILKRVYASNGALTFPIGKGGNYRPVTFEFTASSGTNIITIEQNETGLTGALPAGVSLNSNRTWDISRVGIGAINYNVTLDATSDNPSGTIVMLKKESGVITSVNTTTTISAPDLYTNIPPAYTTLVGTNNFALGSSAATVWDGTSWSLGAPNLSTAAIIAGNYTSATNGTINSGLLTVNSGALIISSGDNITVNGALAVNAPGTFTLDNNANLIQTTNVVNTGAIVVNRNSNPLSRLDYTLWASPVSSQQLQSFSPATLSDRFYTYNPATNQYVVVPSPSTTDFAVGKGYLIRMPNDAPTAPATVVYPGVFTGVPTNGNVNLTVASGTFNAIGNPYPSTVSANLLMTANNLSELYFWRKANGGSSSYATYTLAGSVGTPNTGSDPLNLTPNGIIQVGQGFLTQPSSTTIAFTNAMRVANNANQIFRTQSDEKSRIWLNLTNTNGLFSQTMIAYMPEATQGIDAAIDGRYINDSQTALTSIIDNKEFAIQGRGLPFVTNDVIAIGFKTAEAGAFTIGIDHFDGLFSSDQMIYLKDNLTHTIHNLSEGDYNFVSESGIFNTRFEVVFENNLLAVNQPVISESNNVVIYKQNESQIINAGNAVINSVQVYDITGRLIFEKKGIDSNETRFTMNNKNQVYIVNINTNKGMVTKKIIN